MEGVKTEENSTLSIGLVLLVKICFTFKKLHFSRTKKATVMILGIDLHSGMKTQIAVSIFDLYLYFMVHWLCKFA